MHLAIAIALACVPTPQSQPEFAAPIRLTAEGKPLAAKHLYPSPRIYDIDRDGQVELVVCDLRGRVQFAEKQADGVAAWGELESVETDGRLLKFNNW